MMQRTEVAGATRSRVLAAIRAASDPVDVDRLAADLGLHPNTVRFHTAALEEGGLVQRHEVASGQRGRPRAVFEPTAAGARSGERNYQLLAGILVDHLRETAADPIPEAVAAGRAWARRSFTEAERPRGRRSTTTALLDLFSDMGFDPEPRPAIRPREVVLRNCPFRADVETHQDLICAVHRGILDGLAEAAASSGTSQSRYVLEPLVTPNRCLVRFSPPSTTS